MMKYVCTGGLARAGDELLAPSLGNGRLGSALGIELGRAVGRALGRGCSESALEGSQSRLASTPLLLRLLFSSSACRTAEYKVRIVYIQGAGKLMVVKGHLNIHYVCPCMSQAGVAYGQLLETLKRRAIGHQCSSIQYSSIQYSKG